MTIADVARMVEVPVSTVRLYRDEFDSMFRAGDRGESGAMKTKG